VSISLSIFEGIRTKMEWMNPSSRLTKLLVSLSTHRVNLCSLIPYKTRVFL
jgi:hypothetical protein